MIHCLDNAHACKKKNRVFYKGNFPVTVIFVNLDALFKYKLCKNRKFRT